MVIDFKHILAIIFVIVFIFQNLDLPGRRTILKNKTNDLL